MRCRRETFHRAFFRGKRHLEKIRLEVNNSGRGDGVPKNKSRRELKKGFYRESQNGNV